jgi:hypothetical protein
MLPARHDILKPHRLRLATAAGLAGVLAAGVGSLTAQTVPASRRSNPSVVVLIPAAPDDWTRHFRVGGMAALNIDASFSIGGNITVSGNNLANGIYDDGYVRVDNTGNAGGLTGYWGYNNASQYDASTRTLLMHSTSAFNAAGASTEESEPQPGFDLAYGGNLWHWAGGRLGWELGFGLVPIQIKGNLNTSATVDLLSRTFHVPDGVDLPGAPYQGGVSGEGEPVIQSDPTSQTSQTLTDGTVSGLHTVDVTLYTLRLGPSLYWDLSQRIALSVGAGPAVGVVDGNFKYDDLISAGGVSSHDIGSVNTTELVYGGYVNATLMYHVQPDADIYVGVEYMPLGNVSFSSSGRSSELKLGGQIYLSAGINWPF